MFLLRILVVAVVIAYVVWFVSNRILGKNLALAKVIATTLVITSVIYLLLGGLSYLVEGT